MLGSNTYPYCTEATLTHPDAEYYETTAANGSDTTTNFGDIVDDFFVNGNGTNYPSNGIVIFSAQGINNNFPVGSVLNYDANPSLYNYYFAIPDSLGVPDFTAFAGISYENTNNPQQLVEKKSFTYNGEAYTMYKHNATAQSTATFFERLA